MISVEEHCGAESGSIDHYLANNHEMLLKVEARPVDKYKIGHKNYYNKRKEINKIHELRGMQLRENFEKIQTVKSQKNHRVDSDIDF